MKTKKPKYEVWPRLLSGGNFDWVIIFGDKRVKFRVESAGIFKTSKQAKAAARRALATLKRELNK